MPDASSLSADFSIAPVAIAVASNPSSAACSRQFSRSEPCSTSRLWARVMERGAFGEPGIGVRAAESPLFHRGHDGRAAGRERVNDLSRHPRDLEPAVGVGFLDPVA